ncbi:MAG: FHA domain-containing protein [Planctomycetota bacterium]
MNASLLVVKADGSSQEIVLRQERVVVGREKSAPLRVPARSVSRQHCEFTIEDERLIVRDLGSSNGTFVNRERIDGQAALDAGDLVSVGPAVFALRLDGEPADLEPADVYARGSVELAEDAPKPAAGGAALAAALAGGVGGGAPGDPDDSDLAIDGPLASGDLDDSSMLDFDFDLEDEDEDDQPSL